MLGWRFCVVISPGALTVNRSRAIPPWNLYRYAFALSSLTPRVCYIPFQEDLKIDVAMI